MDKTEKSKARKKKRLTKIIQGRCVHQRRGVVSEEGHNLIYCQDCGKIFYEEDI